MDRRSDRLATGTMRLNHNWHEKPAVTGITKIALLDAEYSEAAELLGRPQY